MTEPVPERAGGAPPPASGPGRLLASSGRVLASRIVLYAATLVIVVATARELGAAGRGAIAVILTISSLGSIIFTIGLPVAGRLLLVGEDPVDTRAYLGLTMAATALLAIVAPLATAAFLPVVGIHLPAGAFIAVSALAIFNSLATTVTPALAAFGRIEASSWWITSGYVAQAVLCVVVAVTGNPGVSMFVVVLAAGMVIPSVGAVWDLRRTGHPVRPVFDRKGWRRLIRTGLPSVFAVFTETATFRIDRLILGVLRTPAAVGIYSVASTAAEVFRLIPWSINQLVFYEVVVGRISKRRLQYLRLATIGGMAVVAAIGALLAPWAIDLLLGPSFERAAGPFRILLLAELALAWYLFDSTLLQSSHLVRRAAIAPALGVVMILVADFVLIDRYGIDGAAVASVLTYSAMAVVVRVLLTQARRRGAIRLMDAGDELEAEVEAGPPTITET